MESAISQNPRYTHGAIALHWIIALLIIANYFLVWSAEDAPKAEEQRLVALHMATGITILLFSVLRVIWRITHPAPPHDETLKSWEVTLAKLVNRVFYFLIIAIPFSGWLMTSVFSAGKSINIYGLFNFPGLPFGKDEAAAGIVHEVHEVLAAIMLLLFIIHVAAALKHQFVDRNGTLGRMIPFLRR